MIGLIGLDYHWTSAESRGRLSFSGDRLLAALRTLVSASTIDEVVLVSTCNRTEIYFAAPHWTPAAETIRRFLTTTFARGGSIGGSVSTPEAGPASPLDAGAAGTSPLPATAENAVLHASLASVLYEHEGLAAARHLFRVSAGLQSMVVGEAQILGQVKEALATSEAVHAVSDVLRALFTHAIKIGKRARAETEIGRADVSVASLATRVANESLGGLAGKSALLIGAGRTSQLCAQLLRSEGINRLILANRTPGSAADLANEVQGEPLALSDIATAIPSVQLIISATAAPHTVLSAATLAQGLAGRRQPLVIVDLAVPPDVEEEAGLLPSVSLYTLDALRSTDDAAEGAASSRDNELALVEEIVEEGVREYVRSRTVRLAVPGIAALRRHVDRSEQLELTRVLGHLEHLSESDRALVTRFGERLVDKMFHHLVSRIRGLAEFDEVDPEVTMRVLTRLFADPDEPREADESATEGAESRDDRSRVQR